MALCAGLATAQAPSPPPARRFTLGLVHLDAPAVLVLAPVGTYVVEVRRGGAATVRMNVELPPDVTTVVTLAAPW